MMVLKGRLRGEAGAAVLQADAGARHHDAGTESHVVRLDEGKHHPLLVGGGEVHRAALLRHARAGELRAFRIDQFRALGEVGVVEELGGRHAHRRGVGDVLPGVGERDLHRLDLQVEAVRGIGRV